MRALGLWIVFVACLSPALAQVVSPPGGMGGALPLTETLQSFDSADVRLAWIGGHWQILAGNQLLKDFGSREQEARQALRIIRDLGLDQHGTIGGSGVPVMEYWLSHGKAPSGLTQMGLRPVYLDSSALRVEQSQGQWCLRDNSRVLFNFGQQANDAQQALGVIRKYRFDQIGLVGQFSPSMYVFLRRTPEGSQSMPPTLGHSTRRFDPPRFSRLAKNSDGTPRFEKPKVTSPLAGLEKVATPVVPPLANLSQQRVADTQTAFQWRTQPRVGAPTPAAANDPAAERIPFDWRQVQVRQDQGDWKLMAGGLTLANFGASANEARLALSALRHYRLGEQWRIGGENGFLTYYTASPHSPGGVLLGLPAEPLQLDQLQVKLVDHHYALCQGQRVMLKLREREDDARKLLDTIKKNRYDRLCRIGEAGKESMTILVRNR